jgi:hypothetical protein
MFILCTSLLRLKAKHPEIFYDMGFVMDVLHMLANYRFKLPVRRFVQALIDNTAFTPQACRALPWDDGASGAV